MIRVVNHPTPAAYRDVAVPFFMQDEAFYSQPLGMLDQFERNPDRYKEFFLWTIHDDDSVVGVAWHTPPYALGLTLMPEQALGAFFAYAKQQLSQLGRAIPGIMAPSANIDRAMTHWCGTPDAPCAHVTQLRAFRLEKIAMPPAVPGSMRSVMESDRPLLEEWGYAFEVDCHLGGSRESAAASAERALRSGNHVFWIVDGRPVSMAGISGYTPNGARVAFVYTPPELRKKGYAARLVAELSQSALDSGRRFCFLFTDLANPISNSIYQKMGYRPVGDWENRRF